MFLHAARLSLPHPLTGVAVELEAALPAELAGFLARIDANEAREHGQAF